MDKPDSNSSTQNQDNTSKKKSSWGSLGQAASIGIEFVICIVIGLALGHFWDSKFQSEPWGMLVGLVLGIFAAFRALFRLARRRSY